MDDSIFRSARASSAPPSRRIFDDIDEDFFPKPSKASKVEELQEDSFLAQSTARRVRGRPERPLSTYRPSTYAEVKHPTLRILPRLSALVSRAS